MKRILLVDDDAPILESLRLRLHRMQRVWSLSFANSAPAALEEFERQPFDVLVTDLRMPGMDGPALLQQCTQRWPATIRIALSGYADPALLARAIPHVHQFVEKPCAPEHLENIIGRCLDLHDLLNRDGLRALVGRIRHLPPLPRTFARLQPLFASDNASARDVRNVIATDAAITARVLQMVNSAFFRQARRITNLEQAVTYLGFPTVRNLVMAAEVFANSASRDPFIAGGLERLQNHAERVTIATSALTAGTPITDDAMLAALLHDIGYWVLAQECPGDLTRAVQMAQAEHITLPDAEAKILGASHSEIGAYLLGLWGLPYPIIEAVAHHHAPHRVPQASFDVLAAIAVGHTIADDSDATAWGLSDATDAREEQPRVDASYLATVNAPFDWEEAQQRVQDRILCNQVSA